MSITLLRNVVTFALLPGALTTLDAQPRPQIGSGVKHARATVTTIDIGPRRAQLLVTLDIDPGWHISWRNPGETGLPTRLTWSLPAGVRAVGETWPVPVITHTAVGDTHTLEGTIPWLIDLRVDSASASDRAIMLTMRYGVCKDVCIPEQLTVQGVLSGRPRPERAASVRAAVPPLLQSRLSTSGGVIAARRLSPTELCLERVPLWSPGTVPEIIADSGANADASLRLTEGAGMRRGSARARVPADARFPERAHVLFVRGEAGVSAQLSFSAPTRHCRAR
jgi:hypothetical protein